jgi:superfamily II DNA or RNA helicase
MIKLRSDYQLPLKNKIVQAWERVRGVLAVCPTGGGKTIIFSSIIHDHVGASAAVVHRKEIVGQISLSLAALGVKHRIIAPPKTIQAIRRKHLKKFSKSFIDQHAPCGVVSVQTLTSKSSGNNAVLQSWLNQITLCVYDEGHHYVKQGLWAKAVDCMTNAKLLFVSATPERADGKGLGMGADGFADVMVEGPTTRWLIDQGYLCGFTYKAPRTDLDLSGLAVTASGDFNATALRDRVVESHIVGDVVNHYTKFASGLRAIVFATDVATAEEMAEAFRQAGYSSMALSGATDSGIRDRELERFENGELQVLVNVDLFDEGFDVPAVECVILARPTQSLGKYLQMIGRGLRVVYAAGFDLATQAGRLAAIKAGTKPTAVILDPVRNWERHGMPDWPRVWKLSGKEKGTRESGDDTVPQRVCAACTGPYEAFYKACPYCGHVPVPAGRSLPEQVEGDLLELDVEAMAALFAKMNKADMDDDEYRDDQLARRIPAVGRGADMKRHKAAKYRRQVLRELVAWWVGAQPKDREQGEVYSRFFHRFGVDIATAFTLNTNDTDTLITRIGEGFHYDIN